MIRLTSTLSLTLGLYALSGCGGSAGSAPGSDNGRISCAEETCPSGMACQAGTCVSDAPVPVGVQNPSGDCVASDDGGREGYHAPAPSDVYLPDCELSLRREYWRVFVTDQDVAYTIPRMDGAPGLAPFCEGASGPEAEAVTTYGLCASAESAADVERVNALAPADALLLTHALHATLRFAPAPGGIAPPPLPDDVVEACALHPDAASEALAGLCDDEQARLASGQDIGLSYEVVAEELSELLNELYGI